MLKKIIVVAVLYSVNVHAQVVPTDASTNNIIDARGCKGLRVSNYCKLLLVPPQSIDDTDHNQDTKQNRVLCVLGRSKKDDDNAYCVSVYRIDENKYDNKGSFNVKKGEAIQCIVNNSLNEIVMSNKSTLSMKKKDWGKKHIERNIILCLYAFKYDTESLLYLLPKELLDMILPYNAINRCRFDNNDVTIDCRKQSNIKLYNNFHDLHVTASNNAKVSLQGTCNSLVVSLDAQASVEAGCLESVDCQIYCCGEDSKAIVSFSRSGELFAIGSSSVIEYKSNNDAYCFGHGTITKLT